MLNKFKVKSDGRTVYERFTSHKCKHSIVGFGESVQWQQIQDKNARGKVNGDWRDGVFLGVIWRTTEFIIGTADGVFKCRTIKQRVAENAYDPKCLEYIKVSYADYVLSGAKSQGARVRYADLAVEPPAREPAVRSGNEFVPRRIYLKPADFDKFGFTEGCPGCTWLQNRIGARRNHNDLCRARVEQAMANDPDERHRVDMQTSKFDTFTPAEGVRLQEEAKRDERPASMPGSSTDKPPEPNPAPPPDAANVEPTIPVAEALPPSPIRTRPQKRSSTTSYSPANVPNAKSSRRTLDLHGDDAMGVGGHGAPGPETAADAADDAMGFGSPSGDSEMLSVVRLIAARAILGSDMMDCISEET